MGGKKPRKVRKEPITRTHRHSHGSKAHRATQATISNYHTLLKRRAALTERLGRKESRDRQDEIEVQLGDIESQINELGGLAAYQDASVHGQSAQRGGDTAKVLMEWLKQRKLDTVSMEQGIKLRCLEIGALKPDNLASCSNWLDNHPIDLRSQHPDIEEQDFFQRSLPLEEKDRFDIISCSLVLNFVAQPVDRGRMLDLIHLHLQPRSHSMLFLVLPLPCVTNSRYTTRESLRDLMQVVGFEQVEARFKEGGKVGYWLYRWSEANSADRSQCGKKRILADGKKRNNFAIILPET